MNDYDFYEYIRRLHLFVEAQDKRIKQLESLVQTLEEDLKNLKNKPAIHVDKIEYKFDQLKVETLEGTLNIGLNPTDLQGIEDFAVEGNQIPGSSFSPADKLQSTMRIEGPILQSLDSDVLNIIRQYEIDKQINIEESYVSFITDDIKKQLPNRIDFYLNQIPIDQRTVEHLSGHENHIIESIKNDIQKGITTFLNNLPEEKKG
ncbi:MAG TPA: spore germination protein GerPC [Pseudoneobacillus sp.]|nr:spore germination protein GerPC [Pseudoneobacillus sp.]